ncbi:MAG: SIR2 family protein [Anaerolineae bacterium]
MINGSKVNIYVFGAGASKHVGAPLTKDFLSEGFWLLPFPDAYDVSTRKFRMVAQLIDRLYGSRLETYTEDALGPDHIWRPFDIPSVNIEDLLSFVDLGLRHRETWLPFEGLQDALHEFIFTTLEQTTLIYYSDCLRRLEDGTLDHNRNCYDKLVDYIMHVDEINCMITFNYDLFLDQAMSINNHGILGDYNIEFAEVENCPGYERLLSKQRRKEDVDLLKLHGSLNWARCPHCQRLFLAYFRRYRQISDQSCLSCGNAHLVPVLVPPTLLKQMDIPELVGMWHRAEHFLERADTLTVIGYSFPDADIEAKWLFKRAIANNPWRPTLTLVEPKSDVREKVLSFLGHFFQEDPVPFGTFEEYCEKQIMS